MVCASIAFYAISYNFASGSGDALAHDSLKEVSHEGYYDKYASNQLVIYRLCSGISTMCAGCALFIGHRLAYGTDVIVCIIQICILMLLEEVGICRQTKKDGKSMATSIGKEFATCFMESLSFLKTAKRAVLLMFCNSFVGAVDMLLLFFLQAKLPEAGMPNWAFSDDALQVRTNTILQDSFPSEQRATLISIESFTFSVIMIVLSPLAGILFSHW